MYRSCNVTCNTPLALNLELNYKYIYNLIFSMWWIFCADKNSKNVIQMQILMKFNAPFNFVAKSDMFEFLYLNLFFNFFGLFRAVNSQQAQIPIKSKNNFCLKLCELVILVIFNFSWILKILRHVIEKIESINVLTFNLIIVNFSILIQYFIC